MSNKGRFYGYIDELGDGKFRPIIKAYGPNGEEDSFTHESTFNTMQEATIVLNQALDIALDLAGIETIDITHTSKNGLH